MAQKNSTSRISNINKYAVITCHKVVLSKAADSKCSHWCCTNTLLTSLLTQFFTFLLAYLLISKEQ